MNEPNKAAEMIVKRMILDPKVAAENLMNAAVEYVRALEATQNGKETESVRRI